MRWLANVKPGARMRPSPSRSSTMSAIVTHHPAQSTVGCNWDDRSGLGHAARRCANRKDQPQRSLHTGRSRGTEPPVQAEESKGTGAWWAGTGGDGVQIVLSGGLSNRSVCSGGVAACSQLTRPPFSAAGDPSPIMQAPLQRAAGGEAGRTTKNRNLTPPPPFSMQHFN